MHTHDMLQIGHYIKIHICYNRTLYKNTHEIGHYICTYKIAIYRRKENHDKFKHSKYQSGNGTANTFVVGLKHKVSREHFIY